MKERLKAAFVKWITGVILAVVVVGIIAVLSKKESKFDYSWTQHKYIAHAMGGIDGLEYSNSLEAFEENYQKGHRVFEVDFALTSDEKLVALHYWENAPEILGIAEGKPISLKEFLAQKIYGKYTPLSCENIFELMQKHPDIYIVTDTKSVTKPEIEKEFKLICETAGKFDANLLDRVVPQIYNEEMYEVIMQVYEWKSVIYTLYNLPEGVSDEQIIRFANRNGIRVITTGEYRASADFFKKMKRNKLTVYMHTYNDSSHTEKYSDMGAHGFYTDYLLP